MWPMGDRPACPCVKTALTAYPFESPEFNLVFSGINDFQFRQVFGLLRVQFRQVFGLLRVQIR